METTTYLTTTIAILALSLVATSYMPDTRRLTRFIVTIILIILMVWSVDKYGISCERSSLGLPASVSSLKDRQVYSIVAVVPNVGALLQPSEYLASEGGFIPSSERARVFGFIYLPTTRPGELIEWQKTGDTGVWLSVKVAGGTTNSLPKTTNPPPVL